MPATRLMPTEEGQDLIDLTREICAKELLPAGRRGRAVRRHRSRAARPRRFRTLGQAGLLSLPYPEEYGGGGQPYEVYLQVVEEIASVWMSRRGRRLGALADLLPRRPVRHRRPAAALLPGDARPATSSAPTACPSAAPAPTSPR